MSKIANEGYGDWPESIMESLEGHDFERMTEDVQQEILGKEYKRFGRKRETTNRLKVEEEGFNSQLGSNHIVSAGYELSEAERKRANEGKKRYTAVGRESVYEARIEAAYLSYKAAKGKQKKAKILAVQTRKAIRMTDDEEEQQQLKIIEENYIEDVKEAKKRAKRCVDIIKIKLEEAKKLGIEIDPKIAQKAEKLANRVVREARNARNRRGKVSRNSVGEHR